MLKSAFWVFLGWENYYLRKIVSVDFCREISLDRMDREKLSLLVTGVWHHIDVRAAFRLSGLQIAQDITQLSLQLATLGSVPAACWKTPISPSSRNLKSGVTLIPHRCDVLLCTPHSSEFWVPCILTFLSNVLVGIDDSIVLKTRRFYPNSKRWIFW